MATRTYPEKRRHGFRRQWASLTGKARSISPKYRTDLFLLVLRAGRWHSDVCRHRLQIGTDASSAPAEDARRLKEGFRRQRESLVRRAHHISRTFRADVFVFATRNGRWYAEEYLHVSPHRYRGVTDRV